MNSLEIVPSVLDRIRKTLVGLKMPRALEVLDQAVRQLERGETSALEVIDTLFAEELTLRENRRVQMALRMAKLSTVKTLAGCTCHEGNRTKAIAAMNVVRTEILRAVQGDEYMLTELPERVKPAALVHRLECRVKNRKKELRFNRIEHSADVVVTGNARRSSTGHAPGPSCSWR
jgi:hypothetical protein